MKKYMIPTIKITRFEAADAVITASPQTLTAAENMNAAAVGANATPIIGAAAARTVRVQTILSFN